jgi:bloom syndrome protein
MHRFLARPPRGSQITSQGKEKEPNTAINLITPASHQDSAAASSQNAPAVAPVHLNPKSNYISDSLDLGLERVFGHSSFRTDQKKIVQVIAEGRRDVFVIMPTGGGKSLLYQLPAILSKGVTIVISPLISLIEDQVSTLINMDSGGIPAAYLNSTCSKKMQDMVYMDLQRAHHGEEPYLKLLYVTPERVVKSDDFGNYLTELFNNEFLARFVIDEAHWYDCTSIFFHVFVVYYHIYCEK